MRSYRAGVCAFALRRCASLRRLVVGGLRAVAGGGGIDGERARRLRARCSGGAVAVVEFCEVCQRGGCFYGGVIAWQRKQA